MKVMASMRMIRPLLGDKWFLSLIFFANLLSALLEGGSIIFLLRGFEKMADPPQFIHNLLLGISVQVVRSLVNYFATHMTTAVTCRWQIAFQSQIYRQILRMSFACVNRYKIGELSGYLSLPSSAIPTLLDCGNRFLVSTFAILVLLITMYWLAPWLTLTAVMIFAGLGFLQRLIVRKLSVISATYHETASALTKETLETLQHLRAIFTVHRQGEMADRADGILRKLSSAIQKMSFWRNIISPLNEISGVILVALFLLVGQYSVVVNSLPLLMTFILIVYRVNGRFQAMIESAGSIAQQWAQLSAIDEILDDGDKEFADSSGVACTTPLEQVEFRNVRFSYSGKTVAALEKISFTLIKGMTVAIVGPSGAGKSSLLDLLLGLYSPTDGAILLNQRPLQEYKMQSWRERLGVVSQDAPIMHDTIAANISFGRELMDEQIREAAKMAGADQFIRQLPRGYQTIVGERGYRLSGGERQRIALARALARDPDLLLLDEATSHLDSASELGIKQSLEGLKGKKTVLIVAHRLSTIHEADHILVLAQGAIKEEGSHRELLERKGLYFSLWNIQRSGE
jgi:ATP-binding cassette subfamily B protein/subfamily B ATP-binding cassette protein MsbA